VATIGSGWVNATRPVAFQTLVPASQTVRVVLRIQPNLHSCKDGQNGFEAVKPGTGKTSTLISSVFLPLAGEEQNTPPDELNLDTRPAQVGDKPHPGAVEGDFPVSAVLTSARAHGSQVAIRLARGTASTGGLALRPEGQRR